MAVWPSAVQAQGQRISEQVYVGDYLTLSAGGQPIKEALAVRAGIVQIDRIDENNPTVVKVKALKIGSTRLILTTETGQTTYIIEVRPDLTAIRSAVEQEFPTANVTVHAGLAGQIIVSGTVPNPEDVDPLIRYVASFLDGQIRNVINNLRVAGLFTIQLEVCVCGVTRSEARNMSFSFLGADQQNYFMNVLPTTGVGNLVSSVTRSAINPTTQTGTFTNAAGGPNMLFSLTGTNAEFLGLLQALRQENVTKILANSSVATLSGRPADFVVGGQAPFGTAGSGGGTGTGVQFKEFGTRVQFLPIVVADGKIRLDISAEVSNIDPALSFTGPNIVAPGFDTRLITTTVEMESGQTLALGGLIQNTLTGTAIKVPVLGDVPFFGTLFRQVQYNEVEQELLIIVTPRYVDPMDCGQMKSKLPGQETRSVTDFELFLEGILEAPRGPREICPDGQYRPAHWWTPNNGRCYPAGACGNTTGGPHAGAAQRPEAPAQAPQANGRMAEVPPAPADVTAAKNGGQ